jgi:hypothetical protein
MRACRYFQVLRLRNCAVLSSRPTLRFLQRDVLSGLSVIPSERAPEARHSRSAHRAGQEERLAIKF